MSTTPRMTRESTDPTRWLRASEAAEFAGMHIDTIRDALRAGELRGVQRTKGGTWKTTRDWVNVWIGLEQEDAA